MTANANARRLAPDGRSRAQEQSEYSAPLARSEVRVGNAVLGYRARKHPRRVEFAHLRVVAIERLIRARHGGPVDTDDGEAYARAAVGHVAEISDKHRRLNDPVEWCRRWCPGVLSEFGELWVLDLVHEHRRRRGLKADEIAILLGVTEAERVHLGLETFGAIDRRKDQRTRERKAKKAQREKARRIANGATPREHCLRALKPWEGYGWSEGYWRRQMKAGRVPDPRKQG